MSDTEEVQFKEEPSEPMSKRAAKKLKKQLNEAEQKKNKKSEHGFVYLGHLPHGFYEDQIKKYFSQFGRVVKVRLARAKSTGNHKGYGFVEFENKEVAEIAAEAMNNYLMFNKVLKCHVIPREKLHPQTFKNAKKRFVTPVASWTRRKYNRLRSSEQIKKMNDRREKKMEKRKEKLKELGINIEPIKAEKPEEKAAPSKSKKSKKAANKKL